MPECISEYFGKRLAAIRESLELKQSTIGDILGCSNGAYSLYERNKRQPSLSVLFNLCGEFGVSIDYLLGCFSPAPDVFAERLQDVLRARQKKSLKEFVNVFKLNEATEKLLISGRCFPNAKTLKNLCIYLDCSVDYLIGLSDSMEPSVPVSIQPLSISRSPYADLSPDHQAALDTLAETFRQQEAWDSFPDANIDCKKG